MSCHECREHKIEVAALEDVVKMLTTDVGLQKMADAYLTERRRAWRELYAKSENGLNRAKEEMIMGCDGVRGYKEI